MTAREEAADAALGVLRSLGREVKGLIREEVDWRREHPCAQAKFHEVMAKSGPRIGRPWHRWRAKVWRAKCIASGDAPKCGMGE